MVWCIVFHNTFGNGIIINKTGNLLVVDFNGNEKKICLPRCIWKVFDKCRPRIAGAGEPWSSGKERCSRNRCIICCSSCSDPTETAGAKKLKKVERSNVAFKCNYCDGGKTSTCISFNGVCSDAVLRYNIEKARHVWCADTESPCRCYLDGKISRTELEDMMRGGGGLDSVCYESHMLRDWMASAGVV